MNSFSATVLKKSKNLQKLGLTFGSRPAEDNANSGYVVFLAKVSGTFQKKTFLVPGLEVLRVNSTVVNSPLDAIDACKKVEVGHMLSIEVGGSLHKAKRLKKSFFASFGKNQDKVGITIKEVDKEVMEADDGAIGDFEEETRIIVTQVDKNGLFPNIKEGSVLHAVNGKRAKSFPKTLGWLKNSSSLTLIVLDPPPTVGGAAPSPPRIKSKSSSRQVPPSHIAPDHYEAAAAPEVLPEPKLRVVACIIRSSPSSSLGLTFRQDLDDGGVIINSVSSNGPFSKTGIQANQKIVKINGHVCSRIANHKFDQAVDLLLQATGRITIEAESVSKAPNIPSLGERQIFSIQKTHQSLQLGLGLKKCSTDDSRLVISKISQTLQKVLGLKEGLQLLRINGVPCSANNIPRVHDQMDQAFPMLSLECFATATATKSHPASLEFFTKSTAAVKTQTTKKEERNVRVVACVIRPNTSVDLGITFHNDIENGFLIVDHVSSTGLFGKTGIKPKQRIMKINGHSYSRITQLKMTQAIQLLNQTQGRLTVEAETVASTPATTHIFCVQKNKKNFQLGIGLEQRKTGWRIYNVSLTLQKVLGLKEGLEIVRVNGQPCNSNNVKSVHEQMDRAFPVLSLECVEGQHMVVPPPPPAPIEEEKEQYEPWMELEFETAEKALPVPVNESNKATAKIVRTTTVELSADLLLANRKVLDKNLGLSLAKHQHLNAIVITGISKDSVLTKQLKIGQVFVSINHICCPFSTQSTIKMLRRKIQEGVLRIVAGDVDHVDPNGFGHRQPSSIYQDSSTDEEEKMMQAIEMGMLKASDEIKEEYNYEGYLGSSEDADDDMMEDVIADDDIPAVELPMELLPPSKKVLASKRRYSNASPEVISA